MKKHSQISALFLVILLAFSTAAQAIPASPGSIVTTQTDDTERTSIHSANNPNLFAIHDQQKTGVNLLDNLPKSNSTDHSENEALVPAAKSSAKKKANLYLQCCKFIDSSLEIKKIIFPFHSHW